MPVVASADRVAEGVAARITASAEPGFNDGRMAKMIYELRTYTMKPGMAATAANHSAEVGRDVRGDDYGKLEGYWVTEIGPLNQVMHLWSFADMEERARLKAELAQNERWNTEYLPKMRPMLVRQDNRILNGIIGPTPPESEGNVYEFRAYRLVPGGLKGWRAAFEEALPVRERHSKIVGLWSSEAGQPNEVCHIWAYPSLDGRAAVREAVGADPDWHTFLDKALPLIEEMHSTIMVPAKHSPLK